MSSSLAFIPDWASLAPFLVAALVLYLTPGVDMAYILARTASQGRRAGVVSAVGVFGGITVHILAVLAGLSALLAASQTAFTLVKFAGAAYLLYPAVRLLRDGDRGPSPARTRPPHGLLRVFWEGVLCNCLNPKIGLFMLAFLPQFVDPAKGGAALQILFLGLLFNLGGLVWNVGVVFSASAAAARIGASERLKRAVRWVSATVLGGLALRLAFSERG